MIDNKKNGSVAEELRQEITKDSKLSVMTAYFTIFAFAELKKELMKVEHIRLLFTDPVFIKGEQEQTGNTIWNEMADRHYLAMCMR